MPGEYDLILKEDLKEVMNVFIRKLLGIDAVKITTLDTNMQVTNEREADFLLRIEKRDGTSYILHAEIQITNDPNMPDRMLIYWLYIKKVYKELPRQYIFYVGREPLKMPDHMPEFGDAYKYTIIDFHNVDCETFIHSNKPEEIIISVLCDFKKKMLK